MDLPTTDPGSDFYEYNDSADEDSTKQERKVIVIRCWNSEVRNIRKKIYLHQVFQQKFLDIPKKMLFNLCRKKQMMVSPMII